MQPRVLLMAVLLAILVCSTHSPTIAAVVKSPASLPILVYHQIRTTGADPEDGPTAISLDRFEAQMQILADAGYTTLGMDQVVSFLHGEPFPDRSIAIHLDDGWKSGLAAVPVLNRFGFRATFWIIAGTGIGWPHADWNEILDLAANRNFEVFAHTMTHPWKPNDTLLDWLAGRTPGKGLAQASWEISESRRVLEQKIGRPVPFLAWPSGYYDDTLIDLARNAGFTALATIDDGVNLPGGDPMRIHRTMIDGRCDDHAFRSTLIDGKARSCDTPSRH
jgi:peptidoglycan/xylan/chitin deacetylase (PgdA/CDA1 family)